MRKGYYPHMMVDQKGRMVAFATGADATSEHEWGTKEMRAALTGGIDVSAEDYANSVLSKQPGIIDRLLGTKVNLEKALAGIPDWSVNKRIKAGLQKLHYEEREVDGVPQAALTFSARERQLRPFENQELNFSTFSDPKDIAGAWDNESFGFKVAGDKQVKRLREFADALAKGEGILAGTFLTRDGKVRLSGVIIAIESLLRPEHRAEMKKARDEYVSNVRLHLGSKVGELRKLSYGLTGRSITYIWPVWRDRVVGGDIVYAVNPGHNVDISYFGPYSYDQLEAWLRGGAQGKLEPLAPAVAA